MATPGITAPVESLTVPRIVAVGSWDMASLLIVKREKDKASTRRLFDARQRVSWVMATFLFLDAMKVGLLYGFQKAGVKSAVKTGSILTYPAVKYVVARLQPAFVWLYAFMLIMWRSNEN